MANYSLTRATTWNLSGYLYLLLASLVSTPILVSSLGFTTFTTYGLITATLALASSVDLGLPQAVVRTLVQSKKTKAEREVIWVTSSNLFIVTGVLAATIVSLVTYSLSYSIVISLITGCITLMQNLISHYSTLPQAEGHFGYYNTRTYLVGTANTIFAAYLALRGLGLTSLLIGQLVAYLLTLIPLVYFSLKYFPTPWLYRPSRHIAQQLISFGLRNQFGKLIGQVQAQYGKYLLATLSPLTVSAYLIAQSLMQRLAGGVSQIAIALYPRASQISNTSKLRQIYLRLQLGIILLGMIGIGLYHLFGTQFLIWWLNNPLLVEQISNVLSVSVWYLLVLILTPIPSIILDGSGHPELTAGMAALTTFIEIILALVLFPVYGLMAPVYASLASILLTTPLLFYLTAQALKPKLG